MQTVCSLILFFLPFLSMADPFDAVPVLSEGRYRPLYAQAVKEGKSVKEMVDEEMRALPMAGLEDAGHLKMLPYKGDPSVWLPLNALRIENGQSHIFRERIDNFTAYSDEKFAALQEAAFQYEDNRERLAGLLIDAYAPFAGKQALSGTHSGYAFPTLMQLKLEALLYRIPLVFLTLVFYTLSLILFFARNKGGFVCFWTAFSLHTLFLAARSYVLGRPPVSNMFETVVYVPWIALLVALITRQKAVLMAAVGVAIALLGIELFSGISRDLENLQPVLNSQFWLVIHVLMVVGSYGAFLLSGMLAHASLISPGRIKEEWIAKTLYIGTALLVTGTILGGVWAAESWGRFWDWDPKESWAFISSCIYISVIHSYRFKLIGSRGLAIGSILGLQAITFTWYGVNYLLGTGLHSYGFGSGGEIYYYLFVLFEAGFVGYFLKTQVPTYFRT